MRQPHLRGRFVLLLVLDCLVFGGAVRFIRRHVQCARVRYGSVCSWLSVLRQSCGCGSFALLDSVSPL